MVIRPPAAHVFVQTLLHLHESVVNSKTTSPRGPQAARSDPFMIVQSSPGLSLLPLLAGHGSVSCPRIFGWSAAQRFV